MSAPQPMPVTVAEAIVRRRLDLTTANAKLATPRQPTQRELLKASIEDRLIIPWLGQQRLVDFGWALHVELRALFLVEFGLDSAANFSLVLNELYTYARAKRWVNKEHLAAFDNVPMMEHPLTKNQRRHANDERAMKDVPGLETIRRLIAVAEGREILVLFILLNFALRSGEARALRWRNLRSRIGGDPIAGSGQIVDLVIEEAINASSRRANQAKNENARRSIPYDDRLYEIVAPFDPGPAGADGLVLETAGQPWSSSQLRQVIWALCDKADAAHPEDPRGHYSPRGLRRAALSWWDHNKVHEDQIHAWAGHGHHHVSLITYATDLEALDRKPHFPVILPDRRPPPDRVWRPTHV